MTAVELAEATKEFGKEIPPEKIRPLSKKERARWEKARAEKSYVSLYVGNGRVDVRIRLDPELLREVTAYAKRHRTSLPKMIDRGLRGLIAFGA